LKNVCTQKEFGFYAHSLHKKANIIRIGKKEKNNDRSSETSKAIVLNIVALFQHRFVMQPL
jgi:hypothetical protein